MIAECTSSNFNKKISIDCVVENPFYNKLSLCIGNIYKSVGDAHTDDGDFFKYFNANESYINDIYMMCRSIEACLKSINNAIIFISQYKVLNYTEKDFIPFDEFCLYHYDVVCHKISTLKDLYFKIINKVYKLELNKATWKAINEHKKQINNEQLFSILNDNHQLMETIENKRNKSSHEGNMQLTLLNDLSLYLLVAKMQEIAPSIEVLWKYEKGSPIYNAKIEQTKKDILEHLNVIKYNA